MRAPSIVDLDDMFISPVLRSRLQVGLVLINTIIFPAVAQHNIFAFQMEGENVDQHITYDDLGRPSHVTHYSIRSRKLRADEMFFHQLQFREQLEFRDSTITDTVKHAFDRYTWGEGEEVFCVTRWGPKLATTYHFGPDQEISLGRLESEHTGRVGEKFITSYTLHNLSTEPVTISFVDLPEHVIPLAEHWTIEPADTMEVACRVIIQPGNEKFSLRLDHGRSRIPLGFTTYGYHISTDDLKNESGMLCPTLMEYYRTGSETLLEVVDPGSGAVIQRYPLHNDRTLIDLKSIGFRELELCAKDYSHGTTTCTSIVLE